MEAQATLLNEIVRQTRELVRIPSQGFLDPLEDIFESLSMWLAASGVAWRMLCNPVGRPVALLITVDSGQPGPVFCLDACVDTAPAGRLDAWRQPPFSAAIEDGRIWGRGTADSKVAVSIFCHLARDLVRTAALKRGMLHVLLDGDEHTGGFGGVKAFVDDAGIRPRLVTIGYPGNEKIGIGARGFYRVVLRTFGEETHSGLADREGENSAILKMARLIDHLSRQPLPPEPDQDFSFGPSLNFAEIRAGTGFSQTPGICEAGIDFRLTPGFNPDSARALVRSALDWLDKELPQGENSTYEEKESWPCYRLERGMPAVDILRQCAEGVFGRSVRLAVSRPSNIGNYLAAQGIPATCGFGVTYTGLHAPNECVLIESILPVYETYRRAVCRWAAELPLGT